MEASILTTGAGLLVLLFGFGALRQSHRELTPMIHILRNEPMPIRDLVSHDGPAEIEGTAKGDEKGVRAPFSGTVCLAYEFEVQEHRSSGKSSYWETLDEGSIAAPFLVEDDTGAVEVDGPRAELQLESITLRLDPGEEPPPRIAEYIRETEEVEAQTGAIDLVVTELNYGNAQRFVERRLDMDESVHVYGAVERAPATEWGSGLVDAYLTRDEATPLIVSDTSERDAAYGILRNRLLWPALTIGSFGIALYLLAIGLLPLLAEAGL